MKRLLTSLKTCLLAVTTAIVPLAGYAEYQRTPEVAPYQKRHMSPEAVAKFKAFYANRANNGALLKAEPSSFMSRHGVRQRPKNILRTPSAPTGSFLALVPTHAEAQGNDKAYLGTLNPETCTLSKLFEGEVFSNGEEYYYETAAVRNGLIYIPNFSQDMVTGDITITWKVADTTNGRVLPSIGFGQSEDAMKAFFYAMTYDEVNDLFYGLALNLATQTGGTLVVVDPKQPTWEPRELADLGGVEGDFMCSLTYNPSDGQLYGVKDTGELCMIDIKSDSQFIDVIPVYEFDNIDEYYAYPEYSAANAFCYSPYDHAFISIYRDMFEQRMVLVGIDAETYASYEIGDIQPLAYTCALICTDPFAEDGAPDRLAEPKFSFDGASLSGTYTVDLPTLTFSGVEIKGDMDVTVTVDGTLLETFKGAAGATLTRNLTSTQGLHQMDIYAAIGDLKSPVTSCKFYVGHDAPHAPTGLKLNGTTLTWDAPAPGGANGGYVDAAAITYDVFFNNEKQNLQPLAKKEFRFANPAVIERKLITVKAAANGQESVASNPLSRTIGEGFELPYECEPANEAEADLFETYNANHDGCSFKFYTKWSDYNCFTVRTEPYNVKPDDWLFLPALKFDDVEGLYEFVFKYANAFKSERHMDNLDIYIGDAPEPAAMTTLIYSHEDRNTPDLKEIKVRFSVAEDGDYVIGLHSKPGYNGGSNQYRGVQFTGFNVSKDKNATSAAPAAPAAVKLEADPEGELYVDAVVTIPTKDMAGRTLNAGEEITVTITTDAGTNTGKGKPGETVTITGEASRDGVCEVAVSCGNAAGTGAIGYYTAYVGHDLPLPPTNVTYTIDDDNLGLVMNWDASKGGANGGYVDIDNLEYHIFTQGSAGQTSKVGEADGLSYHLRIEPGTPAAYHVGPVAVNDMGTSLGGQFVYEVLGTPYNTPLVEEWPSTGSSFTYQKWYYSTDGEFKGSLVDNVSSVVGLRIGDPNLRTGGFMAQNISETQTPVRYQIFAPKFTTSDVDKVNLTLRVWDYANSGTVELWGRHAGSQEFRKIEEMDLARTADGEWVDWEVSLPEDFCRKGWAQVNVRGTVEPGQYALFDTYSVIQNIEHDFTLNSLNGPAMTTVGETAKFKTVIANAGTESGTTSLLVELLGDGKVLDSETVEVGETASGDIFERNTEFVMNVNYLKYAELAVRSTITGADDQNKGNNVKSFSFTLNDHALPVVEDLSAKREGQDVVLEWSAPETSYGSPESFEVMEPFARTEQLGLWTNLDLDGMNPFAITGLRFPEDEEPCGWTVFDCEEMGTMLDERLSPHSGKNVLMARSGSYTQDEEPSKSFDWLISPRIKPGSKLSFWYSTISSQYKETIEIWVSYTDNKVDPDNIELDANGNPVKCGSFVKLRSFTKSGAEAWEYCETKALTDVCYVAIVYGSIGQFAAIIDDITFTPADEYKWDIDSYEVLRSVNDGEPEIVGSGVKTLNFRELNDALNSTYWVRTVVVSDGKEYRSPLSAPVKIQGSSVDEIAAGAYVAGGKGCVVIGNMAGNDVDLYDADGRHIAAVAVESDRQSVAAPAGVVLVRIGETYHKVMVK